MSTPSASLYIHSVNDGIAVVHGIRRSRNLSHYLALFFLNKNCVTCQEFGSEFGYLPPGDRNSSGDVIFCRVRYHLHDMAKNRAPIINDASFNRHIQLLKQFICDLFLGVYLVDIL